MQKFLFTAIYLYPENQSQISILSIDSEDGKVCSDMSISK